MKPLRPQIKRPCLPNRSIPRPWCQTRSWERASPTSTTTAATLTRPTQYCPWASSPRSTSRLRPPTPTPRRRFSSTISTTPCRPSWAASPSATMTPKRSEHWAVSLPRNTMAAATSSRARTPLSTRATSSCAPQTTTTCSCCVPPMRQALLCPCSRKSSTST